MNTPLRRIVVCFVVLQAWGAHAAEPGAAAAAEQRITRAGQPSAPGPEAIFTGPSDAQYTAR